MIWSFDLGAQLKPNLSNSVTSYSLILEEPCPFLALRHLSHIRPTLYSLSSYLNVSYRVGNLAVPSLSFIYSRKAFMTSIFFSGGVLTVPLFPSQSKPSLFSSATSCSLILLRPYPFLARRHLSHIRPILYSLSLYLNISLSAGNLASPSSFSVCFRKAFIISSFFSGDIMMSSFLPQSKPNLSSSATS